MQALQEAGVDGSYAFFDGMHKSCSRCKQVGHCPVIPSPGSVVAQHKQ